MSRKQPRDNSASVSLFPFLAVLLCTMGGLVVLLVAMSQATRQVALREEQAPPPVDEQQQAEVREQLKRIAAITKELNERKRQAEQQLREDQLRMQQVEAHVRKLQEQMALIAASQQELAADADSHYDDRAQAERELARLKQLIEDYESEIAEAKQQQAEQQKSYAVVPYKGNSGTRRQPIYIECRADQVILQPEGVVLKEEDFVRPLGVGNPLAAALRAAREHLTRDTPGAADPDAQPYPLILVRPDGIVPYHRVREAIRSWDTDFGYELIASDWPLSFPAPDPQLAVLASRAVENARLRRDVLAKAAPSVFGQSGGAFSTGSGQSDTDQEPYDPDMLGGRNRNSGSGNANENGLTEDFDQGFAGGAPGGLTTGQEGGASRSGSQAAGQDGLEQGERAANSGQHGKQGNMAQAAANGESNQLASQAASGGGSPNSSPGGAHNAAGVSVSLGGGQGSASAASLNERHSPSDVPIRRTVTVAVFADRLMVGKQPVTLSTPGHAGRHLPETVRTVKQQIKAWGLAGKGFYWRPVIKLDVRNGGQQRAADLRRILSGSGVDLAPVETAQRNTQEPIQ